MKTAISLPDDLFEASESLAKRLGMSRSRLIATALAEFVAKHRSNKITERLNAVYSTESSALPDALRRYQQRRMRESEW